MTTNGSMPENLQQPENDFSQLLKLLSSGLRKQDIRKRKGWRDRNGQIHYVDYVEWHVVADLLDRLAPDWSHCVRQVIQIGDVVAATAAITIQGVTREGVGTGPADSETGIKKAEHDALKRAAVKFGIARELYREEESFSEGEESGDRRASQNSRSFDPQARTREELITPKQLSLIQSLSRRVMVDPEALCQESFQLNLEEISRRAASALIDHLQKELASVPL